MQRIWLDKTFILLLCLSSGAAVHAYKYSFYNATDKNVDVRAFELVAYKFFRRYTPILGYDEKGEWAYASAKPKQTAVIRGSGWRRGLCLGPVFVRIEGDTEWRLAPIRIVRTEQRDIVEEQLEKLGIGITKSGVAFALVVGAAAPPIGLIIAPITYAIGKILKYAPRLDAMNMCTSRDYMLMAHWNEAQGHWLPFIYYFE